MSCVNAIAFWLIIIVVVVVVVVAVMLVLFVVVVEKPGAVLPLSTEWDLFYLGDVLMLYII